MISLYSGPQNKSDENGPVSTSQGFQAVYLPGLRYARRYSASRTITNRQHAYGEAATEELCKHM
jgi:hypothetical protein